MAKDPKEPQRWLVVDPNGKRSWETSGPPHEPPICQGEVTTATVKPVHPPATPAPVKSPTFVGQRQCGTCGSSWVPTK